jgi:hypothetical protein
MHKNNTDNFTAMTTTNLKWRLYVLPKSWYLPSSTHGVTFQKTNTDIFTAEKLKPSYWLHYLIQTTKNEICVFVFFLLKQIIYAEVVVFYVLIKQITELLIYTVCW